MAELSSEDVTMETTTQSKVGMTTRGMVVTGICGSLFAGTYLLAGPFLAPALRKIVLPYVPASNRQVVNVMRALKGRQGKLIDLGSGDGRIVIAGAKRGFDGTGVDLNRWLVLYSKMAARKNNVSQQTNFMKRDLWKFNLSPYNNVVVFGVEPMMERLEKKCLEELPDDSRIVACRFQFPNLKPVKTVGEGLDRVWLYKISRGNS
ncbi:hypothetical protein FSP39_023208 [Pinctada imbricata]|uniref:Uncharacterized protein n=1 Tax=Pinctada imbricata TaxID=66713 RepID=A0AA88YG72_PINIB|nr:hypothetical protein FSP39_023208 [Pinctada imbricata]